MMNDIEIKITPQGTGNPIFIKVPDNGKVILTHQSKLVPYDQRRLEITVHALEAKDESPI